MNTENMHFEESPGEWDRDDRPLSAARGCLLAMIYGAGLWAVIILLACWLWS